MSEPKTKQNGQATETPTDKKNRGAETLNLPPKILEAFSRVSDAALKHSGLQAYNDVSLIHNFLTASK